MSLSNAQLCVARGGATGANQASLVEFLIDLNNVPPNHVVLRIDKFGFSANNITYAMLGENPHFRYYDFYPAPSPSTHGIIPVWGFGTVVHSKHSTIKPGQRLYGYLAMSQYLVIPLDPQTNRFNVNISLGDFPPDRRPYKQLTICETDPMYRPDREDETMLYRPLFWTAFWFEDYLNENKYRNASYILISSASSKTSFTLAYNIQLRKKASQSSSSPLTIKVVGLTSSSNESYTRSLGLYDTVLTYSQIPSLPRPSSSSSAASDFPTWIYADVSGSKPLLTQIQSQLSSSLVLTVALGMTSVESGDPSALKGREHNTATQESFFMPEWLAIRVKALSVPAVLKMQKDAWARLMRDCVDWVKMRQVRGGKGVLEAYGRTIRGEVGPDEGQVYSLWDEEDGAGKARL